MSLPARLGAIEVSVETNNSPFKDQRRVRLWIVMHRILLFAASMCLIVLQTVGLYFAAGAKAAASPPRHCSAAPCECPALRAMLSQAASRCVFHIHVLARPIIPSCPRIIPLALVSSSVTGFMSYQDSCLADSAGYGFISLVTFMPPKEAAPRGSDSLGGILHFTKWDSAIGIVCFMNT